MCGFPGQTSAGPPLLELEASAVDEPLSEEVEVEVEVESGAHEVVLEEATVVDQAEELESTVDSPCIESRPVDVVSPFPSPATGTLDPQPTSANTVAQRSVGSNPRIP